MMTALPFVKARRAKGAALNLLLAVMLPAVAASADLDKFACLVAGHWDNVRQAEADARGQLPDRDRHPRRAMTYIPIANPHMEGQLFAIQNYGERGFDGPMTRVSLHRFRPASDEDAIVHEFLFLLEPEAFGELSSDPGPLARLQETDVRINADCAMYWYRGDDNFTGSTRKGKCITSSFTETPILVEGRGELSSGRLLRHDQNFQLDGEPIPLAGGATPELFDKVARTGYEGGRVPPEIAAVTAELDCN